MQRVTDATVLARELAAAPTGRRPTARELAAIIARLDAEGPQIATTMARETGFAAADCAQLVRAASTFVGRLPELFDLHEELSRRENELYREISPSATVELRPWGRCLICTPGNAPAPLALILPLAFAAAGNRVALASSESSRGTAQALARLAGKITGGSVLLWDGRIRDAVSALLAAGAVDLVYFMGASSFYSDLAARCARAGVELIYEGEGRGVVVIDDLEREDREAVIDSIVAAKVAFNGRMCSAPNAIAVPRERADDFAEAYAARARRHGLPRGIGELCGPGIGDDLDALDGHRIYPGVDSIEVARTPVLIRGAPLIQALSRELFCPAAFLVEYSDWDLLTRELASVRHRLQVTLFSRSRERFEHLVGASAFARYCVNVCPIDQDPLLPWGNYGASGHADVLDFFRKGLRRIIVERGRLLAGPKPSELEW